jgi:hypothetical protein
MTDLHIAASGLARYESAYVLATTVHCRVLRFAMGIGRVSRGSMETDAGASALHGSEMSGSRGRR